MTQKKRIKLIVIVVCAVFTLSVLSMGALSFVKFGTINFPKTVIAFVSISSGDAEYVEIKSAPNKIIMATPNNSMQVFEEYLTDNGYTFLEDEQMGGLVIISQDGVKETVDFSINNYYSLWQWVDE